MNCEQSCWVDNLFDLSDKLPVYLDDLGDIDEELSYLVNIEVDKRDQSFSNKIPEIPEIPDQILQIPDKKYAIVPIEILNYADYLMIEAAKKIKLLERENTWLREQA